jgi:hypothetical protein
MMTMEEMMMTMEDKFEIKSGAPINDIDRPKGIC